MRTIFTICLCILGSKIVFGQSNLTQGSVTFVTSNSAYVKFENTENMSIGDTLFLSRDGKLIPCLMVKNKSSMSCVSNMVSGYVANVGDILIHKQKINSNQPKAIEKKKATAGREVYGSKKIKEPKKVFGSVSAASYSTLSSEMKDNHRTMYRVNLTAPNIGHSKFTFETYLNYRQTFIERDCTYFHGNDVFNVYSLAVRYDASPTWSITLGRKVNNKASSLGAVDGLQAEKFIGNFYVGILAGFRPDMIDFGFNRNLFQYGGYVGFKTEKDRFNSLTTLGLLQQNNSGQVDRRYTYFQHSSTIGRKLNIFSTFELDFYSSLKADTINNIRLTNFYFSVGYQIIKAIDLNVSYDSRKQILYYETFRTEIERLLENDEARQGLRFRLNVRPFQIFNVGVSYAKRFQSNGLNSSDNINGYLSLSKIPMVGGRLYVNYNLNQSNYLKSNVLSFRHTRSFFEQKLDAEFYYRFVDYTYTNTETKSKQEYFGTGINFRMPLKINVGLLGEMATRDVDNTIRVNARISKNF